MNISGSSYFEGRNWAGWIASYQNGDTPVEMIVYTQTSPDVTRLMDALKESAAGSQTPVSIDQTSGFSWPWAWYLRNQANVSFPLYSPDSFAADANSQMVLVHSQNKAAADESLREVYTEAERIRRMAEHVLSMRPDGAPHPWWHFE